MGKIFIQDDENIVRPLLGDHGRQAIVRPDHDEKIFGFEDQVFERVILVSPAGGTDILVGTVVPAGEIWKITVVGCWNVSTANTKTSVRANVEGNVLYLNVNTAPVRFIPVLFTGELFLVEGNYVDGHFAGTTIGDGLRLAYNGYKMKIP